MSSYNFIKSQVVKKGIQSLGMFQNKGFFQVFIPYIPFIGTSVNDLTFQIKNTSIPEVKRESTVIKTVLGEHTIPHKKKYVHEWSVTVVLAELDTIYRKLYGWFEMLDTVKLEMMKTKASVNLLTMNTLAPPTKIVVFDGIYPKNVPALNDLNYDSTNEFLKFDVIFAFDKVVYL